MLSFKSYIMINFLIFPKHIFLDELTLKDELISTTRTPNVIKSVTIRKSRKIEIFGIVFRIVS